MAGSYYTQANVKLYLNIAASDTADDSLLDNFGAIADQHIDNILLQHDERIPLTSGAVLNDVKAAADYYVASLYRGHRGDTDNEKFFMAKFDQIINGMIEKLSVEGKSYTAERFSGRFSTHDHSREYWF